MTHYDITIGNDVARDVHCDIIMGHDVVIGTYHDITMQTDDISIFVVKSLKLYIKHYVIKTKVVRHKNKNQFVMYPCLDS